MRGRFLLILFAMFGAGCASTHFENTPLQAGEANPDRRSIDPASPDRPVILMTFSGGGSRAAALAESVLREMSATSYAASDGSHVLTEDVKLISSVSGGSVTAAWFGLHRGPGHPDGDLDDLSNDFLNQDNMAALELDAINPITWFGLVTGKITRIGAEEALFNQRLSRCYARRTQSAGQALHRPECHRHGGRRVLCDDPPPLRRCLLKL